MQETSKKKNASSEDSKKKERHIVSWSSEEDDILREQITLHGTENWAIIASKFKDKTTRQCRRRWYTYLNSDFKKGGWSPEEDMLLCEAQKVFGNRWTEIAKVVSGRTDNAVKNRFSTLCKKRAKYEAIAKETKNACVNLNNKRVLFQNELNIEGMAENQAPTKKMRRCHISDLTEEYNYGRAQKKMESAMIPHVRTPSTVLGRSLNGVEGNPSQHEINNVHEIIDDGGDKNIGGTFMKRDDPKINALMQQAELLSSLAMKVNTESTEQSMEDAWKVLQDYLNRCKGNDVLKYRSPDNDFHFEDFKDLVEDLRSSNEGSRASWSCKQPDQYESPTSSEYSTGSTIMPLPSSDGEHQTQDEIDVRNNDIGSVQKSVFVDASADEQEKAIVSDANLKQVDLFQSGDEHDKNGGSTAGFTSPLQVTPLFRSLAAGIPSPKFSDSERSFLLRTLGIESPPVCPAANPSQPPTCKRVLLHSL